MQGPTWTVWRAPSMCFESFPMLSEFLPGYLYAFLSSRYGVPLVVSGTYGAIIQHGEPEHIAGLPVPRFDSDVEGEIAACVDRAASASESC